MATAATFNLAKLKTALASGGARSNLFEFSITSDPLSGTTNFTNMTYFCNVASFPGVEITPIEKAYFGRMVKFPGDMVFADFTTTIYQTEGGQEHTNILKWMDLINAPNVNQMSADTTSGMDHTGTGNVFQRTKAGNTTLQVQFIDMFPTSVSEIALSYDTTSDFEQFDVTWAYQTFKYIPKGDNTNSTLN